MNLVRAFLLAVFSFWLTHLANASSTTDQFTFTKPRSSDSVSVLNLYCQAENYQYYQSKLVLLQSHSSKFDYALTTAHGIAKGQYSNFESCFIRGPKGKRLSVLGVHIAKNYEPGEATDWAVLKIKKIKGNFASRYALSILGEDGPKGTNALQVTFPKARGINFNDQNCQALPSEVIAIRNENILSHNCRAIPGQSGSPIVMTIGSSEALIGIQLGKAFVFSSPITKKPEHLGYFRVIDIDMVEEIAEAIKGF